MAFMRSVAHDINQEEERGRQVSKCSHLHDGSQPCSSLIKPGVHDWRVVHAQRVVQLEVDKLQQSLVELQECQHDPVVHVCGQHLQSTLMH